MIKTNIANKTREPPKESYMNKIEFKKETEKFLLLLDSMIERENKETKKEKLNEYKDSIVMKIYLFNDCVMNGDSDE